MDKLELGERLGVYHDGWKLPHYFRDTVRRNGWMCMVKWGEKGGAKSNSALQDGYSIFHKFDELVPAYRKWRGPPNKDPKVPVTDARTGQPILVGVITNWEDMDAWEKVKAHCIFRPNNFTDMLREVLRSGRKLQWANWDDINIHLPRSMYFTKRRLWETLAKNWEGMRANISVFECSAPRKDRVASFILGDMNWESLCSMQQVESIRRWFWESDLYDPERVNKYRIDVDDKPIDIHKVPKEVWDWYWNRKMQEADLSTKDMIQTLDDLDRPVDPKPKTENRDAVQTAENLREKVTPV